MELLNALNVQGRVISALTLRETRSRYSNSKLGFFWALFEPFAHVVVFIGIFSALGRATPIGEIWGYSFNRHYSLSAIQQYRQ